MVQLKINPKAMGIARVNEERIDYVREEKNGQN